MTKRSPIRDLGKPTVLPESTLGMSDQSNGYSRVLERKFTALAAEI
jgi:hypothetical protein